MQLGSFDVRKVKDPKEKERALFRTGIWDSFANIVHRYLDGLGLWRLQLLFKRYSRSGRRLQLDSIEQPHVIHAHSHNDLYR